MRQWTALLPLILWLSCSTCQVQGGIITNQQSLPDSISTNDTSSASGGNNKNETRGGRVVYTASYSNVRISSKDPKSMDKYYPRPAVMAKKLVSPAANIVPVLPSTTSTTTSTTEASTTSTSTSTTTTTTTTPPPSTTPTTTTTFTPVLEDTPPEVIEIVEEMEPDQIVGDDDDDEDEIVTESVREGNGETGSGNDLVTSTNTGTPATAATTAVDEEDEEAEE